MKYLVLVFVFFSLQARAADTTRLYRPYANAEKDIAALLVKAKAENKHLLLQIGGNWCIMCYRFNALVKMDTTVKKMIAEDYLVYHLNYSKENKNEVMMARLGRPQRFGFPVLVVLNAAGKRLHTQNSSLLLRGNGYDADKVKAFLASWSRAAITANVNAPS